MEVSCATSSSDEEDPVPVPSPGDGKKIVHVYQNSNMAAMNPDLGWAGIPTGVRLLGRKQRNSPMDWFVKTDTLINAIKYLEQLLFNNYRVSRLVQLRDPTVGMLCLAPKWQYYYRAEVVDFNWKNKCKVFFLDYGDVRIVSRKLLRQIPPDLPELRFTPRQVVSFRWDKAVAGELSPRQILDFTMGILPMTATQQIGPGQYMASIDGFPVSPETEFKFHDGVDPANPNPNYSNYS